MLFLLFYFGRDRFALEAGSVIEVLPMVAITPIPRAPPCVAGLFNHRGRPVPAIDLSMLALQRPASRRLSTRIVLVNYPDGRGDSRPLGLVAEKVTNTMRAEIADFSHSGVGDTVTPFLGPVLIDGHGMVQWVNTTVLLPSALRDMLFRETVES